MDLEDIAKKMCEKGKGILAADESTGTIAKRFKSINVENTESLRLAFRQTLFSANSMKNYIGGVILFDETIRQKTTLGPSIPELISKNNAIPGIKVDKGAKKLANSLYSDTCDFCSLKNFNSRYWFFCISAGNRSDTGAHSRPNKPRQALTNNSYFCTFRHVFS